jgi:Ca-activated chloride channel family protein
MLLFLPLIPLLGAGYLWLYRRRRRLAANHGGLGLLQAAAGTRPGFRQHIPPMLFLAALSAMSLALARPQSEIKMPSVEGTVVLVFDVSGSMTADDIKPTRLDAAKAAARAFVENQPPTVQVGIVAFSDGGLSIQPPTNEPGPIVDAINRLSPQRATSLGSGIEAALKVLALQAGKDGAAPTASASPPAGSPGVIVLLTDGENNMSPDPLDAAKVAADAGVRIDTIGVGSPQGTTLEVNGFSVHTSLDEESLQQISQISGGTYFNAQSPQDLSRIYHGIQPRLVIKDQQIEITSLFAALGMLVMLAGGAFSLLWFGRLP